MRLLKLLCGEKKHPEGKLVKACIRLDENGIVHGVLLSGDFFADPEDEAEKLIEGLEKLESKPEKIFKDVERMLREANLTIYGVTLDDIIEALRRALSKATLE
jgi:lipoate-protein ligase A